MFRNWNIIPWEYDYLSPHWLLLLLLLVPVYFWRTRKTRQKPATLKLTRSNEDLFGLEAPRTIWLIRLRNVMLFAAATLLLVALARPSHHSGYDDYDQQYKYGIDVMLALDISGSMLARDFDPNRLEAAKKVAAEFIDQSEGDRIGLVVYEGEAFTACPATTDYAALKKQLLLVQPGLLDDGTSIGTGLGVAVTRLRNDSLPSRVIILLTDGVNTVGDISPIDAAYLAKSKNIRVYTIGVGSKGTAPTPQFTPFGVQYVDAPVEIDEASLTRIAHLTGGKYFRATNEEGLRAIYKEISLLEKRRIKDIQFKSDPPVRPMPFLNWALLFMLSAYALQTLYFRNYG